MPGNTLQSEELFSSFQNFKFRGADMFIDNNDKQLLIQMAVNDSDLSLGGFSLSEEREKKINIL